LLKDILERCSDTVHKVYELTKELPIAFSAWSIEETAVALGKYLSRNCISEQGCRMAKYLLIYGLIRLVG